jgi:hypothetical protein
VVEININNGQTIGGISSPEFDYPVGIAVYNP